MTDLSALDALPETGVADETLFATMAPILSAPGLAEVCAALMTRARDSGLERDLRAMLIAVLDPWVADQRAGAGDIKAAFEITRAVAHPGMLARFAAGAQALLDLAPQTVQELPAPANLRAASEGTAGADAAALTKLADRIDAMGPGA